MGTKCIITVLLTFIICQGKVINASDCEDKSYEVVYQSQPWEKAKELCAEQGAKLAVPKTEDEFKAIQKLVRGMYYPNITGTEYKRVVWLGINNLEDYKIWRNVDGQNIGDTGFHQWSGDNGNGFSADVKEPHCVVIDAANPGLRDWWCHRPQPYICETVKLRSC